MGTDSRAISLGDLALDPEKACTEIVDGLREAVYRRLRKRGGVVGLSGGVDSSVCAGLAALAFGPERVLGLLMPETDSAPETVAFARLAAERFAIPTVMEEITKILEMVGCYRRRDDAIRQIIPEYNTDWKAKIVLPSVIGADRFRLFSLVAQSPDGKLMKVRLTASAYRELVAATNFKQRTRKMLEYHHADRLDYAVIGTPNLLEYDQGFSLRMATEQPTSSRSLIFTRRRSISSLNTSASPRRSVVALPPPTPTRYRKARMNFTSHSPRTRSIFVCTHGVRV